MGRGKQESENIDALLTEYTIIKTEQTACEESQIAIATATFSFIAAIVGLNFFFGDPTLGHGESSQFMILGFCPLLVMFFGCLWMRQLYCQTRFGAYIYHLEEDINSFYPDHRKWIFFEHWIVAQESRERILGKRYKSRRRLSANIKLFMGRTSHFYGYVTLGTWLIAPILLYFIAAGLFPGWNIVVFLKNHWLLTSFLIVISIVYYTIQVKYCLAILLLTSKFELRRARISKYKCRNDK